MIMVVACTSSRAGTPSQCDGWSFEDEAVIPEICLYDDGSAIAGDCASGVCLPPRWFSGRASQVEPTCEIQWWVPLDSASGTEGGCAARSFLWSLGEVDEFDRELCEVPVDVPGVLQPPDSDLVKAQCPPSLRGGMISFLPEGMPPPPDTLITVSCWSDTCEDRDSALKH
jgi:hypothetical protein